MFYFVLVIFFETQIAAVTRTWLCYTLIGLKAMNFNSKIQWKYYLAVRNVKSFDRSFILKIDLS